MDLGRKPYMATAHDHLRFLKIAIKMSTQMMPPMLITSSTSGVISFVACIGLLETISDLKFNIISSIPDNLVGT
jgi:hypothetical protein